MVVCNGSDSESGDESESDSASGDESESESVASRLFPFCLRALRRASIETSVSFIDSSKSAPLTESAASTFFWQVAIAVAWLSYESLDAFITSLVAWS